MFKSFKKLSALLLGGALLAVGCATEGDIHKLNERIDALITGKVATLESQITILEKTTLPALETALKGDIAAAKDALDKDIAALKAADQQFASDMTNNVNNLMGLIQRNASDIATNKAAYESGIAQLRTDMNKAISDANQEIANLKVADATLQGNLNVLGQKVDDNFDKLDAAIKAAAAAAEAADAMLDAKKVDKTDFEAAKTALQNMIAAAEAAAKLYTDEAKTAIEGEIAATTADLQGQIDKKADAAQVAADFAALEQAYKDADAALNAAIETLDQNKADKTQVAADIAAATDALTAKINQVASDAAANLATEVNKINQTIADAKAAMEGEIARLDGELDRVNEAIRKINEETIPAVEQQIADLKELAERTYVTKDDFEAYKTATATTIGLMQDAIDGLTAGLSALESKVDDNYDDLDGKITTTNETLQAYYDELTAEDTLIKQALEDFKAIAATKEELAQAKDALNGRIDGVETAYKAADQILEQKIQDARDYADAQDEALAIMITAAYNQAIRELANEVKETTDQLASRLDTVDGEIEQINLTLEALDMAIQQVMDAVTAQGEALNGRIDALDEKLDTKVGELEGLISETAAQTLADAKAYTDEEVGKVWEDIDDIWETIYLIEDVLDDFDYRVNKLESQVALLSQRLQSIAYVPDYDDMKITMNVAYLKNGDAVMPVPQKTNVTYKFMPTSMAETIWSVYKFYEELGEEEFEMSGLGGYMMNYWFYFDITGKLKTRSIEAEDAGMFIQITDLVDYDPYFGHITFEVVPMGIVTEGFVASELNPIDIYYTDEVVSVSYWVQTGRWSWQGHWETENVVGYNDGWTGEEAVEGQTIKFPVYDAEQLEAYRNRETYAVALEFTQNDVGTVQPYVNLIDWDNWDFDWDYDDVNENSFFAWEQSGYDWFGEFTGWGGGESMQYYKYSSSYGTKNSVSSCFNILYPSPYAESLVVEVLKDPYVNDPENPRADAKGWVNVQDEIQKLAYNTPAEYTDAEHPENNSPKVVLENARPLVAVDGVKYTYDELFDELGIYVLYPELTSVEESYEQGDAATPVDEDNFVIGSVAGEYEADEYMTVSMNDDASLADKKLAVGNIITGTYTWQPMVGDPFEWYGHVRITKDQYQTTATAHIDWTYAFDADQDHENFYNRRDEEGNVPTDGYYRREEDSDGVEIVLPENVLTELKSKYGIQSIDELFSGSDPMQFTGYTVTEGEDVEYTNTDEDQKAVFYGLHLGEDGKIYMYVDNFEFIQPQEPGKTYTITASFETSFIEFTIVLTLTTTDRDRTPITLSLGETHVKLNDESCYDVDEDFFTAKSASKEADLFQKFQEQGICTTDDFATAAAFINDQTGEVRNSPIDREPYTDVPADAWFEIYKVFAKTLSGKLTSEVLQEVNGEKQEESRYTYIGQEVVFDWTVVVDLPGYDFLHLEYYTWIRDNAKAVAGLITPRQPNRAGENYSDFEWWSQAYPSYLNGQEENGKPTSDRNCFLDYDVQYINLAELAFNVVDENDVTMSEEDMAEVNLYANFDYKNVTALGAYPAIDKLPGQVEDWPDLWMQPDDFGNSWVFYYRDAMHADIPIEGKLAIRSGNTEVFFPLETRFQKAHNCKLAGFTDVSLDYSKYSVVRWKPFEQFEKEDIVIELKENKVYRESLLKSVNLHDFRPGDVGTTYYVIKDGEWVIGDGENGYIEGVSAKDAYHIQATISFDTSSLPLNLQRILTVEEDEQTGMKYVVFDYTSETEFFGVVSASVAITLETPWQEPLKTNYTLWIKGEQNTLPGQEPETPAEEPTEPETPAEP